MTTAFSQMPPEDLELEGSIQKNQNQPIREKLNVSEKLGPEVFLESQKVQPKREISKEMLAKLGPEVFLESQKVQPKIGQGAGFGDFQLDIQEGETTGQYIGRQFARSGAAGASALLGLPGDLLKLPSILGEAGKEFLPEKGKNVYEAITQYGLLDPRVAERIPGSQEIRNGIVALTDYLGGDGDIFLPQTKTEERADELISDFATMFFPMGRAAKVAVKGVPILRNSLMFKIGNAAATAGGSAGAKKLAESLGAEEGTANTVKFGTSFLINLLTNGRGGRRLARDLRAKADSLIPEGDIYENGQILRRKLQNIKAEFTPGGLTNLSNQDAVKEIDSLLGAIGRGDQITPQGLTSYIDRINLIRFKKVSPDGVMVVKRSPAERRAMNRVFDVVNEAVTDYGTNQNPDFLEIFSGAQNAYSASAKAEQVAGNFIKAGISKLSAPIKLVLGLSSGGYGGLAVAGAEILGTGALARTGKIYKELAGSPVLREYYAKVIKSATENNIPALRRDLIKLDTKYKEEQKEFEKKVPKLQPKK